jgi:hypothetical protein
MFSFLSDIGNHADRVVGRYPKNGPFLVDTARVSDGEQPYETAVQHPEYNNGKMVIVEAYPTREKANIGHARWVKIMTSDSLPDKLVDCLNSGISQVALSGANVFLRNKK